MIVLKFIKTDPNAIAPFKGSEEAAGLDLASIEDVTLQPNERKKIRTGIAVQIPRTYFGLVRPRSGTATKNGLDICTSGVIDADYRGELFVTLINHDNQPQVISKGMRIAQILILPVPDVYLMEIEKLDVTERNEKGFGSTGLTNTNK
jgi:dUTP pyrophosphatase